MKTEEVAKIPWPYAAPRGGILPFLALPFAHLLGLELSLLLGWVTRKALSRFFPGDVPIGTLEGLALALLLFPLGYTLGGLYPGYGLVPVERFRREVTFTFAMFLTLITWNWLFSREPWARGAVFLALAYALILVPLFSTLAREILIRLRLWGAPILILGAAQTGALLAQRLKQEKSLGLNPVGFLDDDPAKWHKEIEGLPVLGPISRAEEFSRWVKTAIVSMPGVGAKRLAQVLEGLPFPRVILIPDLLGLQSLWVSSRDLSGVLGLEIRQNLLQPQAYLLKRLLDYALGIPLFLLSLPVIGLLALWVKRVSPGPAFFFQEREGLGGRTIRVPKLRTMYLDAEERLKAYLEENPEAKAEWERFFKLKKDPRVLPGVGTFLRRTSLDELPQLWNVLKGEMSLVGPRPFPHYHLAKFSPEFRELRHKVLPGLTGLWQVSARSEGDLTVQEALDTYYIRNWSIWLDLYVLARTLWVLLTRKGAY